MIQTAYTQQGTIVVGKPEPDYPAEPVKPAPPPAPACVPEKPLKTWEWDIPHSLQIHNATTRNWKATWSVRGTNVHGSWPRTYDFHSDCNGWISDHFVSGHKHARVYWNLDNNSAKVTNLDGSPVDANTARDMARFAKRTIFPGLNLGSVG